MDALKCERTTELFRNDIAEIISKTCDISIRQTFNIKKSLQL